MISISGFCIVLVVSWMRAPNFCQQKITMTVDFFPISLFLLIQDPDIDVVIVVVDKKSLETRKDISVEFAGGTYSFVFIYKDLL